MDKLIIVKQVAQSVLSRRKKWVALTVLVALAVFIPIAWMASKEPPRFRTAATILIENRPDKTPLFQEFSPFRPLAVQLAILRSRSLGEAVIETLPRASVEDLIENPYYRDYVQELQNTIRRLRGQEIQVDSPQRRALAELQRARVRFMPSGETGIVEIQAEASKPRVALDIATTYIEVLLSRTRSFNVDDSKVTREYLEQQNTQASTNLNNAENALRQFTVARGGVRAPARNQETIARLTQIEQSIAEIQASKNMSQNRLQAMKTKLDAMPAAPSAAPRQSMAAAPPSARMQLLRAKLATLERQLLEYSAQYTDQHPRMTLTRSQIEDVKRELGEAARDTPQVAAASQASTVPMQDRAAFAETVGTLEASVLALGAQEDALREQGASLRKNLTGLSRDEMEYTRLNTEVESNRRLMNVLSEKLSAARIREQGEMKVVKMIDPPNFPVPAANEKRMRMIAIAVAVALLVGLGVPTAIEYFNRPVESEEDVRQLTGLPVLAAVPRVHSRRPTFTLNSTSVGEEMKQEDSFLFTESFRRLRVEIQLLGREMPLRRILITSALPSEGKSTVVVNLGLAFGEVGKQVIIADADFHRPTLHRTLKTPNTRGFSDLLTSGGEVTDALSHVAEGVRLSPRGASSTALTRSGLGSQRLAQVLDRMAGEAEYVLLDSSPVLLIPDNLYMAAAVDAVLLVVQAGVTRPRDLLRTKELFEKVGTPIIGVVLNQIPLKRMTQYYSYYKQYKAYVSTDGAKA